MKWEYKIVKFFMPGDFKLNYEYEYEQMVEEHNRVLNELGRAGWEYIHILGAYWYFKRPLEEGK